MTIERNGVKFELTDRELYDAYCEQRFIFDREDIKGLFDNYEDDELIEIYGVTRTEIEAFYDDAAIEMRRNIDKYEMSWEYARDEAIDTVIRIAKM